MWSLLNSLRQRFYRQVSDTVTGNPKLSTVTGTVRPVAAWGTTTIEVRVGCDFGVTATPLISTSVPGKFRFVPLMVSGFAPSHTIEDAERKLIVGSLDGKIATCDSVFCS
jgi:hypothetical protein